MLPRIPNKWTRVNSDDGQLPEEETIKGTRIKREFILFWLSLLMENIMHVIHFLPLPKNMQGGRLAILNCF